MVEELEELEKQMLELREKYNEKAEEYIINQWDELFNSYPKLEEFTLRVSNHEFNDGDATEFYISTDEPEINGVSTEDVSFYGDGEDDDEVFENTDLTVGEVREITAIINSAINTVDNESLESLYGRYWQEITFTRERVTGD